MRSSRVGKCRYSVPPATPRSVARSRPARSAQMVFVNDELRAELLRRVAADQEARHALDAEAMAAADGQNLSWLRQVIADVGWPGKSLVGEDGAQAAWLLAQHADSDPAFQRRCLDLLTAAAERGEATIVQQAYLTDRVLLHEGKPQEYGTQAIARDGRFEPRKLRDPDHVDQRRASVGLGSLAEYLARMAEHHAPEPIRVPCPACQAPIEAWPPDVGDTRTATCPECGQEVTFRTAGCARAANGLVKLCTKRFRGNVEHVAGALGFGGVRPTETAARLGELRRVPREQAGLDTVTPGQAGHRRHRVVA